MRLSDTESRLADLVDRLVTSIVGEENIQLQPGEEWGVDLSKTPPLLSYRVADAAVLGDKTLSVTAHELAHLLHTTPVDYQALTWDTQGQNGLAQLLIFAVEDRRIERLFSDNFPGAKSLFNDKNKGQWTAKAVRGFPSLPAKWRFLLNCNRHLNGYSLLGMPEDRAAVQRVAENLSVAEQGVTTQNLADRLGPVFKELIGVVAAEQRAKEEARKKAEAESAIKKAEKQKALDEARAAGSELDKQLSPKDETTEDANAKADGGPTYNAEGNDVSQADDGVSPSDAENNDLEMAATASGESGSSDGEDSREDGDNELKQNGGNNNGANTSNKESSRDPAAESDASDVGSRGSSNRRANDGIEPAAGSASKGDGVPSEGSDSSSSSGGGAGNGSDHIDAEDDRDYNPDYVEGGGASSSNSEDDDEDLDPESSLEEDDDADWCPDGELSEEDEEGLSDEEYAAQALGRDTNPPDVKPTSIMDEMVADLREEEEFKKNPFIVEKRNQMDKQAREARKVEKAIEAEWQDMVGGIAKDMGMAGSKAAIADLRKVLQERDQRYDISLKDLRPEIAALRRYAMQVLKDNNRNRYGGNYDRGRKIKKNRLFRITTGDPRLFERKTVVHGKSYAIGLCVDQSGSMGGYTANSPQILAFQSAVIIAEAFESMIDTTIVGFSSGYKNHLGAYGSSAGTFTKSGRYRRNRSLPANIYARVYKPMNIDLKYRRPVLAELSESMGGTPLSHGLEETINQLKESEAEVKALIAITDGYPHSPYLVPAQMERAKKAGIATHMLFIDSNKGYGSNAVLVQQIKDMFDSDVEVGHATDVPKSVLAILRSVIRRSPARVA